MDNQRMLSSQEAVVRGTEGGPGPTGFPPTTAAAAHARHPERFVRDVPRPLTPAAEVWINPPENRPTVRTLKLSCDTQFVQQVCRRH